MREILFRGKRESGGWYYGDLIHGQIFNSIYSRKDKARFPVRVETIGQYTGLTDKNGTMIFEGDIMETAVSGITHHAGVVEFADGSFGLRCTGRESFFLCFVAESYTIIGNIHDNPELLQEETP